MHRHDVVLDQRQHSGQNGAPQARGEHDLHPGQAVTTTPATGASSSTGAISAMTAPLTPGPSPVSITRATVLTVSLHREIVCAANRHR